MLRPHRYYEGIGVPPRRPLLVTTLNAMVFAKLLAALEAVGEAGMVQGRLEPLPFTGGPITPGARCCGTMHPATYILNKR